MTTTIPVHAVGDGQPRPQPLRVRGAGGSRALIRLAGVGIAVLCLTVDALPFAVVAILAVLSLPVTFRLARSVEWY